jgi:hypothetical protein
MEAIRSSETSVNITSTRCHITEDCFLQKKLYITFATHQLLHTVCFLEGGRECVNAHT